MSFPNTVYQSKLSNLGACGEAREWVGSKSEREAWLTCPRADWLLWFASKQPEVLVDRRKLILSAVRCARSVLHLVRPGDDRPLVALDTTEAYLRGEATLQQVRDAANAAYYAAAAAAAAYAAAAAAAYAAAAAAADAAYAAHAADDADAAAAAANAAHATTKQHQIMADLVRTTFREPLS